MYIIIAVPILLSFEEQSDANRERVSNQYPDLSESVGRYICFIDIHQPDCWNKMMHVIRKVDLLEERKSECVVFPREVLNLVWKTRFVSKNGTSDYLYYFKN